MTNLCAELADRLNGRTVATAESCTGGGIGVAITSVSGSSAFFKGGVISYNNWVKENVLGVKRTDLCNKGAVSAAVAEQMAIGVRRLLRSSIAVSATGIAGPNSDEFATPVGTVFIGYCDSSKSYAKEYHFSGDREDVRQSAIMAALELIISECKKKPGC